MNDAVSHFPVLYRLTMAMLIFTAFSSGAQSLGGDDTSGAARGNSGQVVATGVVPDEATKQMILGRLRALYGRDVVVDEITVGGVAAPKGWAGHIQQMLVPEIRSVSKGELRISGRDIEISGAVADERGRKQVISHMAQALNSSFHISNGLEVAASGQKRIDRRLDNRIVEFESGSARLTSSGRKLLDDLTPTLLTLQDQGIEIIGHTDNRGPRASNNALSTARAEAVKDYLVARGMNAGNLISLGAGEQRPLASNDSPEGRARNRRIEFRLRRGR